MYPITLIAGINTNTRGDTPVTLAVEFLTPYQLHKRWGGAISPKTLANWRVKNIGPRWVKIGGRIVYPMTCVIEFESRNDPLMQAS